MDAYPRSRAGFLFACAFVFALLAGRWAQGLFTTSEFVHFSVNFPTVLGAEVAPREQIGGPWAMLPASEWEGYPAGGMLVWGREGEIVVDVGRQGLLKRWLQPNDITLSTHWLRNVGTEPRRIGLALEMCGLPVTWETFERGWDDQNKVATRTLLPGEIFNMDWHVTLSAGQRGRPVLCDGAVVVRDAEDGTVLTRLPLRIVDSTAGGT
ncbi:MAG: hypothetical protein JRI25_05830 [Deltaproteobacteria bacterium]|nr:hypothetical protein [Deltaproteobacteria bacterium]